LVPFHARPLGERFPYRRSLDQFATRSLQLQPGRAFRLRSIVLRVDVASRRRGFFSPGASGRPTTLTLLPENLSKGERAK
jgi:hypothetical protein